MSTQLATLTNKLAARLDIGDGSGMIDTLKATAFKGQVTDQQMMALLIVANQYGLNPWTKEIYAFPDKNNGIVPVVGVDGWSRIINSHAQFDGIDFEQDEASCTCTIHRKDRGHPIRVTEYMVECKRPVGPWQSHPYRMLRHKALIQCARLAFGFVGIFDQDEAERIIEVQATEVPRHSPTRGAPDEVSSITKEREEELREACDLAILKFTDGDEVAAYEQVSGIDDSDEKMFVWNYLKPNSALRSAIKRLQKADREANQTESMPREVA
ncbi:phage recombination protein Bet [Variovorax paradoxus]|uniref:phage recombination protein Bet n=1 Tax=Variovorax paradoxus TaxID=34073 RepID=UPI00278F6DDC|nr:phage recombination protein Bet [Variovorax paradoxus]MDQ0571520.1 phage recombination protein Bet [Variovorax paradoxus]